MRTYCPYCKLEYGENYLIVCPKCKGLMVEAIKNED